MMHKAWCNLEEVPYNFSRSSINGLKNRRFESILSKITRPVAAIKSLRFALLDLNLRLVLVLRPGWRLMLRCILVLVACFMALSMISVISWCCPMGFQSHWSCQADIAERVVLRAEYPVLDCSSASKFATFSTAVETWSCLKRNSRGSLCW